MNTDTKQYNTKSHHEVVAFKLIEESDTSIDELLNAWPALLLRHKRKSSISDYEWDKMMRDHNQWLKVFKENDGSGAG
jgi:hypothetical protein